MVVALVVVTLVTALCNAVEAVANFMRAEWVKRNSRAVGVPDSWLPFLGFVKGAAAVGLAIGLVWRPLGIAAGAGLVVFFVLATALHLRERVFHNFAGPLLFLALSVAVLWLMIAA
ncbi:DoxX family protein [Glycomyces sp. TRM65418]|uniref:DoxX family protein n=1 Tax=Glycomyces sp. TRM65418 TaxID=2867006 RepID=UPI001CE525DD|nr:DoxX family protein [Glycomyces sp. TRM65418]MCC3765173.1 DoxX family protein [Glycomyces sp. TRM65418]QZD54798.1 DoxX family protein [Glycomyces sp. TRM65418]